MFRPNNKSFPSAHPSRHTTRHIVHGVNQSNQVWHYPGWWTHVPSLQVTVGPREQGRGFVAVTGELVVVWTSQFGPQMVDEEDVLWGWYTVTEV